MGGRLWENMQSKYLYYGVLTHSQFLSWSPAAEQEFFRSGEAHVASVLNTLQEHFGSLSHIETALDFGCGVGRLVIPLAQRFSSVIGVDIADRMRSEAQENCMKQGISNVQFCKTLPPGQVDLVHSYIVLQHIPPAQGISLIANLLDRIRPGGYGMLHITYDNRFPLIKQLGLSLRRRSDLFHKLCNVMQKRAWDQPCVAMYVYDLVAVMDQLQTRGITEIHVKLEQHGAYSGALLFFKKPQEKLGA